MLEADTLGLTVKTFFDYYNDPIRRATYFGPEKLIGKRARTSVNLPKVIPLDIVIDKDKVRLVLSMFVFLQLEVFGSN
jgi:hypothetical protein